ncbi:diguanylate cyclase (GGDEF)-like protein [Sphingomonas jejuensis]|uniref:Diguanylate cyclase (GGDEF)-like protein n=1 Tax=Sphingomonas jejuensis TaxID=904715 RepID=A0ABX0XPT3_9SPHN|nr:EAL domain-containing protein [Sphingomonas jejuensis]NJC35254.1 diguanylate cyclase (GGDEF)-like protein [Sphingomonas jejuensis]
MRSWLRLQGFGRLRTRLLVLYAGLFAAALISLAAVAQTIIRQNAEEMVRAELAANGSVYDRLWALRTRSLKTSAAMLARDFGFRDAVASADEPTIRSALTNVRKRAGATEAFMVDMDGGASGTPGALADAVAAVPFALENGRSDAVVCVEGAAYRLVLSPIMAPMQIGWVVFAVKLDGAEMDMLERLSAIPLRATIVQRTAAGWRAADDHEIGGEEIDRLIEQSTHRRAMATLNLSSGRAFATAKPLAGVGPEPVAAILIRYPLIDALAPYRSLQIGIALAGLIGLLLVVLASRRLAQSIARPIAALDAAARALEEGTHSRVEVEGRDEIGRLAASFNRMADGIQDRENRISHLAFHDTLTGLPNRAYFRQALDQAIASGERNRHQVAVLCLDLDRFKDVNDTLGHPVGDALLQQLGRRLTGLSPDGMVARLGGDEFAIILSGQVDVDRPRALAQAIMDAMRQPLDADQHQIAGDVSIGIAVAPNDGSDADALMKSADLALYRAKQDGRGVFRFFEPELDAAARRRRQVELDLRDAIRLGHFELHYQPVLDLKNNRVGALEALLRWRHPERGLVLPSDFIGIAEDSGLIIAIGEWVLHEACREARRWPAHVRVAVNVSPLQFRNSGFPAIVMQALAASGLPPERLEIEITESVFLEGEEAVVALLHRLRSMGIRIALDDFGTGYSSLSYLRGFPFDKIKIDRSFVTDVARDAGSAAIVRAIVHLAKALGMDITAEGVEDAAQLSRLRGEGCDNIQGYLFSRPVSSSEVDALIGTRMEDAA